MQKEAAEVGKVYMQGKNIGGDSVFIEKVECWYDKINKYHIFIGTTIGLLLISIFLDISPCGYCLKCVERFFEGLEKVDSNLISVSMTIWTAMIAIIIFYFGLFGNRVYGIRIVRVIIFHMGYKNLFIMLAIVIAEIPILLAADIFHWWITLATLLLLQIMSIAYLFLLICMETSRRFIRKQIRAEVVSAFYGSIKDDMKFGEMFLDMVNAYDYKDIRDLEILKGFPLEIAGDIYNQCKNKECSLENIYSHYRRFMREFTYQLFICAPQEIYEEIVKEWLCGLWRKEELSDNIMFWLRKGIMEAIVIEKYDFLIEILDCEFKDAKNREKIILMRLKIKLRKNAVREDIIQ